MVTGGGFADYPIPAPATVSLDNAALRSATTILGADLEAEGIRVATLTIAGQIVAGTSFDPARIADYGASERAAVVTGGAGAIGGFELEMRFAHVRRLLLGLGTLRSRLVVSPVLRRTNKEKSPMAVFNGAFPILPGKDQAGRDFAAACMGERRKGFQAQLARSGLTRETWALQETPMGSFMLVWFEAPDVEKAFTDLATSGDEFTTWFRDQVKDLTGVDLGAPPESPPPDVLVDATT